jgi:hypothetical protein
MSDKKLTTGGFFRKLVRHVVYGDNENPLTTVVKEGIKHGKASKEDIETAGAETPQGPQDRHSHHERAPSKAGPS